MVDQRRQLLRRCKRLAPQYAELIMQSSDQLIKKLSDRGFKLPADKAGNDLPLVSNELRFERPHSQDSYAFVLLTLADDGELGFGLSFGVRDYAGPHHDWSASANLAKKRLGFWKTYNLGADWLTLRKQARFESDWDFLEKNIDDIVRFLETGIPNEHMYEVLLKPEFQPYGTPTETKKA